MAKIPPKKNNSKTKGKPPELNQTIDNLQKPELGKLKPMNFKMSPEFHKEFKSFAVENDMSMHQVLEESFELFQITNIAFCT